MDQRNRVIALACSWLLMFSAYSSVLCISPILNLSALEFGLTAFQAGLLFSAPVFTLALVAFMGGYLGDQIGPRKAAGLGAVVLALSALLRGISPSFAVFFLLNLLVGIGWGLIFPNLPKIVKMWFSDKVLGTATGIYSTGVFAGGTLALAISMPVVFPLMGNWRGVCLFWGVISVVIAVIWWFLAKEPTRSVVESSIPSQAPRASFSTVVKNKHIWVVAIFFGLAANMTFYIVTGWFPAFFLEKGLSEAASGLLTSLVTVAAIPAVFLVPFASDRLGLRRPFLWISCVVAAMAFFVIIFAPFVLDIVCMIALGATLTATYVMCLFLPLELMPSKQTGTASGIVISVGYVGGAFGPQIAGALKDLTGSLVPSIVLLVLLMVISAGLAFLIPETGWRRKPPRLS